MNDGLGQHHRDMAEKEIADLERKLAELKRDLRDEIEGRRSAAGYEFVSKACPSSLKPNAESAEPQTQPGGG